MNKKRMLGLFIFALVFSSLILGVVSAVTPFQPVVDFFTKWGEGNTDINIAKFVFWVILTLFIYSILAYVPFVKGDSSGQKGIRFILAFLVSFLSIAYLTSQDLYLTLTAYSALGVVLGAIIPFVIILFFSIEMGKSGGVGGRLISKAVWIGFIVYMAWKIFDGYYFCETINKNTCISYSGMLVFLGIGLVSIVYIWFGEKLLLKQLFKEESKVILSTNLRDVADSLTAEISRREERSQELGDGQRAAFDRKTDKLRTRLEQVQRKLG